MVEGLIRLMDSDDHVTGPINIGNPGEFTIRELADQVLALTGSASVLAFHPLPADDPRQRKPDIAKAQALLGWTPVTPLHSGLVRTAAYLSGYVEIGAERKCS